MNISNDIDKIISYTENHRLSSARLVSAVLPFRATMARYIERALQTGRHEFMPLYPVIQPKKDGGIRMLTVSSVIDRSIIQAILREPGQTIQQDVINRLCCPEYMPVPPAYRFRPPRESFIYSGGPNDYVLFKDVASYFAQKGYTFCIRCDLSNFFACINRDRLYSLLRPYIKEGAHLVLMRAYFNMRLHAGGRTVPMVGGLPAEEPASHLLANLYLHGFDSWVVSQRVPYARFVDDMCFFFRDRNAGERFVEKVSVYLLTTMNLSLNAGKTRIEDIAPGGRAIGYEALQAGWREPLITRWRYTDYEELKVVRYNLIVAMEKVAKDPNAGMQEMEEALRSFVEIRPVIAGDERYLADLVDIATIAESHAHAPAERVQAFCASQLARYCPTQAVEICHRLLKSHSISSIKAGYSILAKCRAGDAAALLENEILGLIRRGDVEMLVAAVTTYMRAYSPCQNMIDALSKVEDLRVQRLLAGMTTGNERAMEALQNQDPLVRLAAASKLDPAILQERAGEIRGILDGEISQDVRIALYGFLAGIADSDIKRRVLFPPPEGAALVEHLFIQEALLHRLLRPGIDPQIEGESLGEGAADAPYNGFAGNQTSID